MKLNEAFSTAKSIKNFVTDLFSSDSDGREKAIQSSSKKELDLVEKYGNGFLSTAGRAARIAMGQKEEGGYSPFEAITDIDAPKIQLGSSRAAQAPALGGIQSSRLSLAVQTAMRRKTQSNADFQRLLSQQVTSPRMVRGRMTMGLEPARSPQVKGVDIAKVRKESD